MRPFLRRRYLYLLLPIAPIFALACAVAYLIPPVYHASAKFLVEAQQIPTDLARPTVTTDASQQIAVIRQRLMTREILLQIARKFQLYTNGQVQRSPSVIVELMRGATVIEQIDVGSQRSRRNQPAVAFSVSFDYGEPRLASSVANEFVALILEQNIKTRTSRAAETRRFFEKQVVELNKDLAAQEGLIVEFKRENEASLPENLGYRRVLLTRLQAQVSEIDREIGALEADRERIVQNSEGAVTAENASATETELARLRVQLTQLRAVYSERHPSVRKAKKRLEALEKVSATEEETAQKAAATAETNATVQANSRLSAQTAAIDRKIVDRKTRRAGVQRQISSIEETILKTPQVSVALRKLTRKYEDLQDRQRQAQAKVAQAATGELLEESRQAEKFDVIERATAPSRPTQPNRPLVMLAGLFLGVASGIGLVLLVELLDGSIQTGGDLERRLQMRPLATIPVIGTADDQKRKGRKAKLWVIGFSVLVLAALTLVHVLYQPLDLLLYKVMQLANV